MKESDGIFARSRHQRQERRQQPGSMDRRQERQERSDIGRRRPPAKVTSRSNLRRFSGGSAHMRRPPSITPLGKPHRNKPVNLSYDSAYCAGRVAYLANTRRRFEAKPNMCWQEFFFRNLLVFSMSLPIASLLRRLAPIVSSLILRLRLDGQLVFSYFELNCSSDVLARTTWM